MYVLMLKSKYILNKLITFIYWQEEFKDRKTNDRICGKQGIQEISYRKDIK